jgi:hypothetical protein
MLGTVKEELLRKTGACLEGAVLCPT